MNRFCEILFWATWWTYDPAKLSVHSVVVHWFNLFEGAVWFVFAALVVRRYLRFRHSSIEIAYAVSFFLFGLTDFREAYFVQSWLLWVKLFILVALFCIRRSVMRRYYPESKVY